MTKLAWALGIAILFPWNAIAGNGYGFGPARKKAPAVKRVSQAQNVDPDAQPVKMCQSFRIRDGVPVKVGVPHPCREPRNQRLASNERGGAVLPQ